MTEFAAAPPPDTAQGPALLAPDEPAPVAVHNPDGRAPVLLLCDHASNFVPRALDGLGLPARELSRHIGYDIGILPVSRQLSEALDAPLVYSRFSRLIVDPNRQLDDPTLIPEVADGTVVPGNRHLDDAAIRARLESFFWPYHHAVSQWVGQLQARGRPPAVLCLHSFTPELHGRVRPWEAAVLWDSDPRLPVPALDWLSARGYCVGDNEPYSGRGQHGYTQHVHAERLGLANILIELRQDLIDTEAGQRRWADELVAMFRDVLADPGLYHVRPR